MKVDLHSHIIPGVDDGSKSTAMSVAMLQAMRRQGADWVVATPHYYLGRRRPEEYLEDIADGCAQLSRALAEYDDMPKLTLGYEVYYFRGISDASFLDLFTIGSSKYLLLELPTHTLKNAEIEDIFRIRPNLGITPILAHIERFLPFEGFDFLCDMVRQGQLLAQVNASSLAHFTTRKKALAFLERGVAQFVGSDAHNTTDRAPQLDEAQAYILKKAGPSLLEQIDRRSLELMEECVPMK